MHAFSEHLTASVVHQNAGYILRCQFNSRLPWHATAWWCKPVAHAAPVPVVRPVAMQAKGRRRGRATQSPELIAPSPTPSAAAADAASLLQALEQLASRTTIVLGSHQAYVSDKVGQASCNNNHMPFDLWLKWPHAKSLRGHSVTMSCRRCDQASTQPCVN